MGHSISLTVRSSLSCTQESRVVLRYNLTHGKGKQQRTLMTMTHFTIKRLQRYVLLFWTGAFRRVRNTFHLLPTKWFDSRQLVIRSGEALSISQRSDPCNVKRFSLHSKGSRFTFVSCPESEKLHKVLDSPWPVTEPWRRVCIDVMLHPPGMTMSTLQLKRAGSVEVLSNAAQFWKVLQR